MDGELLGLPDGFEPFHVSLAPSGRLVRDFAAIVQVLALPMFTGEPYLPLRCRVGFQPVRYDDPRRILRKKRLAAFVLRRPCTRMSSTTPFWSMARHRWCCLPRMRMNTSSNNHLSPGWGRWRLSVVANSRCEAQTPLPNGLVTDLDAPRRQDQFDFPQAQAEAVVQPHRFADDLGRKAETAIGIGRRAHARQPATPERSTPT